MLLPRGVKVESVKFLEHNYNLPIMMILQLIDTFLFFYILKKASDQCQTVYNFGKDYLPLQNE